MIVGIATALGVLLFALGLRRWPGSLGEKFLVGFLGFWTAAIIAGNALSPFGLLGHPTAYAAALALACAMVAASVWRWRPGTIPTLPRDPRLDCTPRAPWLRHAGFSAAVVVLVVLLALNLWIAVTISPTNPDSQMYRLPRIYFYASHGSLTHFAAGIDGRMLFYPLNGALLLMPIAVAGWPTQMLTLASVWIWTVCGVLIFEFCRRLGASAFLALWTALLVISSPIFLALATSTNDEILAGCGTLLAIYFFWRYLGAKAPQMLVLAGLATGCAVGTKLQFFYLWPAAMLFAAVVSWRAIRAAGVRGLLETLRAGVLWGIPALALGAPFLVYNHLSTGHLFDPRLAQVASNAPFNLVFALQNLFLHSAELLASPFFELARWMSPEAQQRLLSQVNSDFVATVTPHLCLPDRFFLPGEAVRGIWNVSNTRPTEDAEWIGFLWLAFLFCAVFAFAKRHELPEIFPWLLGAAALWWVSFCFSVRFFGPMGVHLTYGILLAAPTFCLVFARIRSWQARIVRAGIVALCLLVNLISAIALFTINPYRNVFRDETVRQSGRDRLARKLANFDQIKILPTHWGIPYLEIIRAAPTKRFQLVTTAETAPSSHDRTVEIHAFPRRTPLGKLPVRIPNSADGFRLLSEIIPTAGGSEYVFARGYTAQSGPTYAVLDATIVNDAKTGKIALSGIHWPQTREPLEFRISFSRKDESLAAFDWTQNPKLDESFTANRVRQTKMTVEVRRVDAPHTVTSTEIFPFKHKGTDLLEADASEDR